MFKFLESRDPATIAVKVEGKVTEEDADKLDQHVKETFGDETSFNILAIFDDLDGTSLKGFITGTKFDAKRWDQIRKFAVSAIKNGWNFPRKQEIIYQVFVRNTLTQTNSIRHGTGSNNR
ncbi:hypothetical protein SAMN05421743_13021 [Thalassobacillus cyri]|uniref:Uncharacterized protein n=1 Tax=Thalassobacillus cyri TaxID=571932 RepID=A0A1H4HHB4_9BACI|nr:hypothetical protein SAMN05421743_13021 [Thalassobacillus cyri]